MRLNTRVSMHQNSRCCNFTLRTKSLLKVLLFIAVAFELQQLYMIAFVRRKPTPLSTVSSDELRVLLRQQEVWLTSQQLQRLNDLRKGKLTREDLELVIARYNEDISWSEYYASVRTIYDKSDDDQQQNHRPHENESENTSTPAAGKLVRIQNLGRESYAYLHHIVLNYDRLASLTVFTQGTAPAHGYLGHRNGGGHLFANSTLHDYILSVNDDGWFIFTGAIYIPTLAHQLRTGYNKGRATREQALSKCPTPPLNAPGGSEYKFDLDDWPHLKVFRHIASRCVHENSTTCQGYSFWDKFVKLPHPPGDVIYFAQGAIFAVTREQIRRRPRSDYIDLLKEVKQSADPSAGFFLEWFWYYIVTSDVSPCPSATIPASISNSHSSSSSSSTIRRGKKHEEEKEESSLFDWAKERPYYKTLPFQERVKFTKDVDVNKRPKKKKDNFCLF